MLIKLDSFNLKLDSFTPLSQTSEIELKKSLYGLKQSLSETHISSFFFLHRYKDGHAIRHWKETQHCFSLELETQRVWDYVGDNYVHRLIQSKTDGKLVELNFHGVHADDNCESCNCGDSGIDEALFNSKFDAIVMEYNDLLTSQLENQRKYFESLLQEVKEEDEREISKAIHKAGSLRLQKLHTKLNKEIEEKRFLEDINENLLKNQETWKSKIQQIEKREQAAVRLKDEKIRKLEEQLQRLISSIEAPNTMNDIPPSASNEVKDAKISLSGSSKEAGPSPANTSRRTS